MPLNMPYGAHLPIFPMFYVTPTEDAFERTVERLCDRADKALLCGDATKAQYRRWMKALHVWAKNHPII